MVLVKFKIHGQKRTRADIIREEQDPRLQGRAPGFRGEGYQVRDKTGIRQGQDRDKTETSQG